MRILLVYPEFPDTFWSFRHALKFIRKKATSPPLGLLTIASMLPDGWQVRLVDLNITALKHDDLEWADVVFLSAMVVQRESARVIVDTCVSAGVPIVAGGPLFLDENERFPAIDHFVLNEAEITLPEFLTDFIQGKARRIYQTDEFADLSLTPIPRWDLVNFKNYATMNIQLSRGCPYDCEFCNITAILGRRPRIKSAHQIVAELDSLYQAGWRGDVFFVDDNFIGNKKIIKTEVLPDLIAWHQGKIGMTYSTEVSINLADDSELMKLMTEAGFTTVFVGIETPDEGSLEECHKTQNTGRDLIESVKRIQRAGLQVQGGFIIGFDHDTPSIFQHQIEFIQKSGIVAAMVGLLQAPHGTRLYQRLLSEGRILTATSGNNVDGSTNVLTRMDKSVLLQGYRRILEIIYSPTFYYERIITFLREYQPPRLDSPIKVEHILALWQSIYLLGMRGVERVQYWKLWLWVLLHKPRLFPTAITLAIYGYHFRLISQKVCQ